MSGPDAGDLSSVLAQELRNFQEMAHWLMPEPGDVPRLAGIDVWGSTRAPRGTVGGDHLIYVDFKQRYDLQARIAEAEARGAATVVDGPRRCGHRAGIAVLDAAGHQMTNALLAAMVHQAFLLGALYEPDRYGEITTRLFENLNTRLYRSSGAHKFVSLLYGRFPRRGRSGSFRLGSPSRASSRRVSTDSSTSKPIGGCRRRVSASRRRCT